MMSQQHHRYQNYSCWKRLFLRIEQCHLMDIFRHYVFIQCDLQSKIKILSLLFCGQRTGNSNVVLNEADVVLCLGWEVVPLPGCRCVRLPTREGLILNLHFVQHVHVGCDCKNSIIKNLEINTICL